MEFSQMKLSEFAAWLRAQPSDRMWNDGNRSACCPIARYSGHLATAAEVGMPTWANYFIRRFDFPQHPLEHDTVSQAHALRVLAMTESRYAEA